MARPYRPGLDPKRATPKEIADRAEAASFTTDAVPLKKRKVSPKVAEAVERAVDAVADKSDKTKRMMSKHEFHQRTGFDRHTIDDWIENKGMPAEKVGTEYRIDLRAAWKWREEYVVAEAMKKTHVSPAGVPGAPGARVGFLGHVWLKPGEEIKAMKDYLAMGVEQKRLAHIDDLEAAYNRALAIIRQSVMAVPERLYREKAGFPEDRIIAWRKAAIEACKQSLAEAEGVLKKAFKAARSFD